MHYRPYTNMIELVNNYRRRFRQDTRYGDIGNIWITLKDQTQYPDRLSEQIIGYTTKGVITYNGLITFQDLLDYYVFPQCPEDGPDEDHTCGITAVDVEMSDYIKLED